MNNKAIEMNGSFLTRWLRENSQDSEQSSPPNPGLAHVAHTRLPSEMPKVKRTVKGTYGNLFVALVTTFRGDTLVQSIYADSIKEAQVHFNRRLRSNGWKPTFICVYSETEFEHLISELSIIDTGRLKQHWKNPPVMTAKEFASRQDEWEMDYGLKGINNEQIDDCLFITPQLV